MSKLKIKRIGEDGSIYTSGDIKGGINEEEINKILTSYVKNETFKEKTDWLNTRINLINLSMELAPSLFKTLKTIVPYENNKWVGCDTPLYQIDPAGYYVNAAKVCNEGSGWGHSYDLILGNYDDKDNVFDSHYDSYIKIASKSTKNDDGEYSQGNIDVYSKGSLLLTSEDNVNIRSTERIIDIVSYWSSIHMDSVGNDSGIVKGRVQILSNLDSLSRFLVLGNPVASTSEIRLGNNVLGYYHNYNNSDIQVTLSPNFLLCADGDFDWEDLTYFKATPYLLWFKSTYEPAPAVDKNGLPTIGKYYEPTVYDMMVIEGANGINSYPRCKFMEYKDDNKYSFVIERDKVYAFGDLFLVKKDKEIRFKTSSNNSMRLTEGEGFKIFTNLYATQDHVTDISEFTEDEQAILKTNTVLKLLLQFNKRITELENKINQV